jgi:hypothetical protein
MTKFTGRRKKIVDNNLDSVLTQQEISSIKQIKNIQNIDINNFALVVESLNENNTILERKKLNTELDKYFSKLDKLSAGELHEQINEVLFVKELIFKLRSILNQSNIAIDFRKPFFNLLNKYEDSLQKINETIIEYRNIQGVVDTVNAENHVSLIVFDIYEKVLSFASPDTSVPNENLKTILTNHIMTLQERMNNDQRSDTIVRRTGDDTITQLPNPTKFFKTIDVNTSRTIDSIQDLYLLFSQLKLRISQMVNIKPSLMSGQRKRGDVVEKYNEDKFNAVKKSLVKIVNEASNTFMKVLLRNYSLLLTQIDDKQENVGDYFSKSLYMISPNNLRHVYDNPLNFLIVLRDTHSKTLTTSYDLFVRDLFNELFRIMDTLPTGNEVAKHLSLVRYAGALDNLEELMELSFFDQKRGIVKRMIELRKGNKTLGTLPELSELEKISTKAVSPVKRSSLVAKTLDSILQDMTNKPVEYRPVIIIEDTTEMINTFFKNFKPNTNYQRIVKKALLAMRVGWKDKLPLAFYEKYAQSIYKSLFIAHFTGFFQGYSNIYGLFNKDLVNSTSTLFGIWVNNRIDGGKFLKEHVKFIDTMIEKEYMVFNESSGIIEFDNNKLSKNTIEIESYKNAVTVAHEKVINLLNMLPTQITNDPVESTSEVCRHIVIENKLNKLYETQRQFPEDSIIKSQIHNLEADKLECEISTKESIICRYCNVKMGVLISDAPETFARVEEQIQETQLIYLNSNVQELIRDEQAKKNTITINKYLDSIISLFNITKSRNVSVLDNENAISIQQVEEIKDTIVNSIRTNDRNIFNFSKALSAKGLRTINVDAMKSQVVHDIMKFLVIMNVYNAIAGKIPSSLQCTSDKDAGIIQCLFSKIQSLNQFIQLDTLKKDTRLNYRRTIFNQAVSIHNSESRQSFAVDDQNITTENLTDERMIIIAQDFGLSSRVTRPELTKVINAIPENVDNDEDITSTESTRILSSYMAMFDNVMEHTQLFTTNTSIPLDTHLALYINYNKLKNIHQDAQRLKIIDQRINEIDSRLSVIDTEEEPLENFQEAIQTEGERDRLTNEKNTIKELMNVSNVKLDVQDLMDKENNMKMLPINMSTDMWNFINLYQYLKYNSRSENLKNTFSTKYNKAHMKIDLTKLDSEGDLRKILNDLNGLYAYRKEIVKSRLNVLKFLDLLVRMAPYLQGKITVSSFMNLKDNSKFIIKSSHGSLSFTENLTIGLAEFLGVSMINIRLFVIEKMLNDKDFQHHVRNTVVEYMNDRGGNAELAKYRQELKDYRGIDILLKSYEQVIAVCPVCPTTNTNSVMMKIHLTANHQVHSNDNITTVLPYNYSKEMGWAMGKSNQTGSRICPYCPMRNDSVGVILTHIRNTHLNLNKSAESYKKSIREQYFIHLNKLYDNYEIVNGNLVKMTGARIRWRKLQLGTKKGIVRMVGLGFDKSIAMKLDVLHDKQMMYVKYCDHNMDSMDRLHVFDEDTGICNYCNRGINKLYLDGSMNNTDRVDNLVNSMKNVMVELLERYCITSAPRKIREDVRINKCTTTRQMLKDPLQLLTFQQHWVNLRNLPHVPLQVVDNIMNVLGQYITYYKRYYKSLPSDSTAMTLEKIDNISDAIHTRKAETYTLNHPNDYINNLSKPYTNIHKNNEKLRKMIFETAKIERMNKNIVDLVNSINSKKLVLNTLSVNDNTYKQIILKNRRITQIKKDINSEVTKNADKYINSLAKHNSNSFAKDLLTASDKDLSLAPIYTDIMEDLEKRNVDSSFFNNRTNILKYIPNDLMKYLKMFVSGNKNSYHRSAHLMSSKK